MRWRKPVQRTRPLRTCRNEGCGRPAEGETCDTCALEWSLYHREQRLAGLFRTPPGPR